MSKSDKYSEAKRGEENPMAIMTWDKVNELRRYAKNKRIKKPWGWKTRYAEQLNISLSLLVLILKNKRWPV